MATTSTESIRQYLNLDGKDRVHVIMTSRSKKITGGMKHSTFVKAALELLNPMIREYIDGEVKAKFEASKTKEEIANLEIPSLPKEMLDAIVTLVDKQKHMNLPEKTLSLLDAMEATSTIIGKNVYHMAMHYAKLRDAAPLLVDRHGKSI